MGGNVSRRSNDEHWPSIRGQQPDFIHREERDRLHKLKDLGVLRSTALFLSQVDFETDVLRRRLARALHDTTLADGTPLDTVLTFDDAQLEDQLLLQAMYLVEDQSWDEVADALRLARQLTYCELPVNITQQDLEKHQSKQAYMAQPRVIAQWKMVGRHVGAKNGTVELFGQPGGGLRAVEDDAAYAIDLTPPLPANNPIQQNALPHNPPVSHRIGLSGDGWSAADGPWTNASFSGFIINTLLPYKQVKDVGRSVRRDARGGVLAGLIDRPPHQPVAGTTAVTAYQAPDMYHVQLLLTAYDQPFIAWLQLCDTVDDEYVLVSVKTSETPAPGVAESAPFKHRFPLTTALARPVLGPIAPIIFDG
ncbi:unnamed protein product [Vitrella brassicaformis CCMP3155]|uniref:Uncharacterized protein n=1 Tax=Vitrella brassicaformis (strain CCMP3155) TaxID=1169540 RepID=A0A0G4ERE4_VITBC|nr:unnamed protein product [Vitrella brassicaformis CCMP3155]|eukprot:CEL99862.1 unnamed protein product [Vitrella brassicaformis CCMP3155]